MPRQKNLYLVANWKTNPKTLKEAAALYRAISQIRFKTFEQVVVCPPTVFLPSLKPTTRIKLGVQDIEMVEFGAHTGSTNPAQLASAGATYAIIGHSERRQAGDIDEIVNKKLLVALKAGFKVILCVGERDRDDSGEYLSLIKNQIEKALVKVSKPQLSKILIAYEPVWAIGDKALKADTPENFQGVALFIKKTLAIIFGSKLGLQTPILYGGSVNPKNAAAFVQSGQADGLLIGRASLTAKDFKAIAASL